LQTAADALTEQAHQATLVCVRQADNLVLSWTASYRDLDGHKL